MWETERTQFVKPLHNQRVTQENDVVAILVNEFPLEEFVVTIWFENNTLWLEQLGYNSINIISYPNFCWLIYNFQHDESFNELIWRDVINRSLTLVRFWTRSNWLFWPVWSANLVIVSFVRHHKSLPKIECRTVLMFTITLWAL